LLLAVPAASHAIEAEVYRYGYFEQALRAPQEYADPLRDVRVEVEFQGPKRTQVRVPAFWDGGRTWRVRFSPERAGSWKFRVLASGFTPTEGSFRAREYKGPNLLLRCGAPRLSRNRRYFVLGDGTPWFWLADTAWNGALLSTDLEWREYLANRAAKNFTAVQFVLTQWRAGRQDELGQVAFTTGARLAVNPLFFQRMDKKFAAVAEKGLVAAPVLLWALTSKDNESPGVALSEEDASALAGYMVARYGAMPVVWILGGDGDYRGKNAERWKKIGRTVFPEGRPRRLVTMHPRGMQDPWPEFQDEPWLDFLMYQSGHGGDARKWRWNATQGTALGWKLEPPRPVIDGEPNYEGHVSYAGKRIDAYAVRRAAYYSLLAAPVAGITYGAHGIWYWARKKEVPLDHPRSGEADPWRECVTYPGSNHMRVLRQVFDSLPWWELRPDRTLLAEDSVDEGFTNYIMPSRTEKGDAALIYLPANPVVKLNLRGLRGPMEAFWVDPRTGRRTAAAQEGLAGEVELRAPDNQDWLLLLRRR